MRWTWRLAVWAALAIGASSTVLALFGIFAFALMSIVLFGLTAIVTLSFDILDAGGDGIGFGRFLECLGFAVVVGLLWPITPIVFAWADHRSRADEDDVGDA